MPKREDEYWASRKEGLSYCMKHKRYYRSDIGCQLCQLEEKKEARNGKEDIRLERCPDCLEPSLFWNDGSQLYECMNLSCKHAFNKSEFKNVKSRVQKDDWYLHL